MFVPTGEVPVVFSTLRWRGRLVAQDYATYSGSSSTSRIIISIQPRSFDNPFDLNGEAGRMFLADSGLKVNSDSDGEGERFSPEPGMAFTMPGMFSNKRSGAGHHTGTMNPPKGGSDCRPGDCPCGNYGRSCASDSNYI